MSVLDRSRHYLRAIGIRIRWKGLVPEEGMSADEIYAHSGSAGLLKCMIKQGLIGKCTTSGPFSPSWILTQAGAEMAHNLATEHFGRR